MWKGGARGQKGNCYLVGRSLTHFLTSPCHWALGILFDAHVQVVLDCNIALLEGKDFLMEKNSQPAKQGHLVTVSIPIMH